MGTIVLNSRSWICFYQDIRPEDSLREIDNFGENNNKNVWEMDTSVLNSYSWIYCMYVWCSNDLTTVPRRIDLLVYQVFF